MLHTSTARRSLGVLSSLTVLVALAGVVVAVGAGCDDGGGGGLGPADGGNPDTGVSPVGTPDGGGDTDAGCTTTGTGTVNVVVNGLPAGVDAKVTMTGPSGATPETAAATISSAGAGNYTAAAARVKQSDPIVGTLFDATVSPASFCLTSGQTQTVTVTYAPIPTSNKLWVTSTDDDDGPGLRGFASSTLGATGAPASTVRAISEASKSGAFDKDGNLWSVGLTVADAPIERYAAADLASAGKKTPDREITLPGVDCSPAIATVAFDKDGNLWAASPCKNTVYRFPAAQLAASGALTPAAADTVTGPTAPEGVAFDAAGNMWVSDEASIYRYDAGATTPSLTIHPKQESGIDDLSTLASMAFDKDGNLWVAAFTQNAIFKLTTADQSGTGTKNATTSVQMTIQAAGLLTTIAFDESGGLWTAYSAGKFGRIDPSQLGTTTNAGAPTPLATIVSSADVTYAGALAFFPSASNLPVYGKF